MKTKPEPVGWWCEWEGECFSERCGKGPNHVHCTPVYTRTQVRKGFEELARYMNSCKSVIMDEARRSDYGYVVSEVRRRMEEW